MRANELAHEMDKFHDFTLAELKKLLQDAEMCEFHREVVKLEIFFREEVFGGDLPNHTHPQFC